MYNYAYRSQFIMNTIQSLEVVLRNSLKGENALLLLLPTKTYKLGLLINKFDSF